MNRWNSFVGDLLTDWWGGVEGSVDGLVSQVKAEARKEGLDARYLFFILFKHPETIESLPVDSRALDLASTILSKRSKPLPKFSGFKLPEMEDEGKVNAALTRVAVWARDTWLDDQAARLVRLTKSRLDSAAALIEAATGEAPKSRSRLMEITWQWMRKLTRTHWFMGPTMPSSDLLAMLGVPLVR